MKTLLKQILKKEHEAAGLYLTEAEDFVYLWKTGTQKPVAQFSAHGVEIRAIWQEADKHLSIPGVEFTNNFRR